MKAYIAEVESSPDQGNIVIFAKTAKLAKKQALDSELEPDNYIDLRVIRYSSFDDCEGLTDIQMTIKQWRDGWWFHAYSILPDPDKTTDKEFIEWLDNQEK
ncbi:hypothetical protein ACPBEI_11470 [Latilactobacillus sakei]